MIATTVETAKHITFAPRVFRISGIVVYTANVAIRKMEDIKVHAL